MKNHLLHAVLIPDGNRRWAKKRGFLPWIGHRSGMRNLEKLLEKWQEIGFPYFTFWGCSWDNLTKRPKREVEFLIKIFEESFNKLAKSKKVHQNEVNIKVIGRWEEIFPESTKRSAKRVMEKTKNYKKFFLTLLMAYDGRQEMISAFKKIVDEVLQKKEKIKINEKTIEKYLWTGKLPDVDLIIRTGCEGDPHNSAGFMMWKTSYSQFYFTETLFPDFSPKELEKAINDFKKRERRFGK